ncbi:MAG TPA: hypothetical protein VG603_00620 [Chitinophagales bacterium]|nr:hypothetical protein [Chitinophagales bacterium]
MLDKLFNPSRTIYKWDRFWVGFLPGLILPLLAFPFFYMARYHGDTFMDYVDSVKNPLVLSPLLSFGAIFNLFVFFLFIRVDRFNAARGVIGATILYIIPIVITKFFM